jgi:hypothetical protein
MGCQITLTGKLVVGGEGCGGCSGGSPSKQLPLSFACSGKTYGAVVSSDCPQQIQTLGALGVTWQDLIGVGQIGAYQLLYLLTKTAMRLRIGAAEASLLGNGASWPVVFAGTETFAPVVDGVTVPVAFTAATRTAAQTATAINQAAVGAGLGFLPASVDPVTGQLRISGRQTGTQGTVTIATALAAIGFGSTSAVAVGSGSDLDVNGLQVLTFEGSTAPTRIQISGQGQIEVLAAGTSVA